MCNYKKKISTFVLKECSKKNCLKYKCLHHPLTKLITSNNAFDKNGKENVKKGKVNNQDITEMRPWAAVTCHLRISVLFYFIL